MTTTPKMPALFIGHGSPMNALERNRYTEAWRALGASLAKPKAVLCISAHWLTRGLAVTTMPKPRTIHDFGGFPQALFDVRYPAPGSPALAGRVCELLKPLPVALDTEWGLDHGAWSVLVHLFPGADVPVVQLSLDATQPEAFHYAIGQQLAALRDEGVLILGTGNVVHNLRRLDVQTGAAHDWATRFEAFARQAVRARDHAALIDWRAQGADAALATPTPEHYWPLLPVLGTQAVDERAEIVIDGIELGAISMMTVQID
ncbi:MAG: 4,5-DOPA dioxygenase extradiol [Stagnimonas sp.]|nr:4,5-DOPA dioxygenase extradiol [Stagnimonas sp.]